MLSDAQNVKWYESEEKILKKVFIVAVFEKKLKNWPELPPVTLLTCLPPIYIGKQVSNTDKYSNLLFQPRRRRGFFLKPHTFVDRKWLPVVRIRLCGHKSSDKP